jgi:hypothetical protein
MQEQQQQSNSEQQSSSNISSGQKMQSQQIIFDQLQRVLEVSHFGTAVLSEKIMQHIRF